MVDDPPPEGQGKNQPWGRRITDAERLRLLELERQGETARLSEHAYVAKKD